MEHFSTNQREWKYYRQPVTNRNIDRLPVCDQGSMGFDFESDWLGKWREFSRPNMTNQNQSNMGLLLLDTELKIALTPRDTYFFFAVLSTHFQSKVSLEHQLPTATQVRKKRTSMKNKNTVIYLCMNLWNCRSALLIYCFFTYILDPEKHRRMHRFFFSVSANCKCQGTTWFVLIPLVVERRQWFGFVSLFFAIRFSLLYRHPGLVVSSCVLDPQRVTSIWFLLTISPLNHSLTLWE